MLRGWFADHINRLTTRSLMGAFDAYSLVVEVVRRTPDDDSKDMPPLPRAGAAVAWSEESEWDGSGGEADYAAQRASYHSAPLLQSVVHHRWAWPFYPQQIPPLLLRPPGVQHYRYVVHRCPFMPTPVFCFLLLFSVLWTGIGAVVVATAWLLSLRVWPLHQPAKLKLP